MRYYKPISILLCCQMLLSLLCLNVPRSFADDASELPALYQTIEGAKTYIIKHQNRDGGWPLVPGGKSDAEVTAFAIWALIDAGWGTGSRIIRAGVTYLKSTQTQDGSWNNNTAHTIFSLIALAAAETDPKIRLKGLQWMKDAQNANGSWGKQSGSPGNILYTAAVLAGFKKLGFNQRFEPASRGAQWLGQPARRTRNDNDENDTGWSLRRGGPSNIFVTAWVLQGLSIFYDIDRDIFWLKQHRNADGGFPVYKGLPSDPEVTASVIMALAARSDLLTLNTRRVAIDYLTKARRKDGSFVSNTPIELEKPTANLQSTCFVLIAIHAKTEAEQAQQ